MSKIIKKSSRFTLFILLVSGFVVLALSSISAGNGNQKSRIARGKKVHPTLKIGPNSVPISGTLNPGGPNVIWDGSATPGVSSEEGETSCVEGRNCDTFLLTLSGTPAAWVGKVARITISWGGGPLGTDDYDVYVHKGTTNSGPIVGSSAAGGAGPEVVDIDPNSPSVGTGVFSVHVVYWLVTPPPAQYHGVASPVGGAPTPTPNPTATPTATPLPAGTVRFQNYYAPPGVAEDAGEPSIGINWNTEQSFSNNNIVTGLPNPPIPNGGTSNYYGGFLSFMLKITFDDCPSPANATWDQKTVTLPATTRAFGDPILFTDRGWPAYTGMPASLGTGRTFVSQLEGLTPAGSTMEYTDNDGNTFSPSEGGAPSGVDHQTIGGGPFHTPLPPGLIYPNSVYYASQSVADATSELSFDGGITFPFQTPMFTVADCAGLHGHIKIAPDGTAFVPDKGCASLGVPLLLGGEASVIVSEDNNVSWHIRPIPGAATSGNDDPSVGVATDSNTIFLGYQAANGHARIAVSHDKGLTWAHDTDVGILAGVQNCAFPAVVAGDGEQNGANTSRAAFAFFGTTTGGSDADQPEFPGVWYLYVATTFDGGLTWTTTNATPNDPIQRGGICGSGACRNLLDFFGAEIDKKGRILVGAEDGCIGGCVNGGPNSFTAKAFISRQSGGKRMYVQFDPSEPTLPGAPLVSGNLDAGNTKVTLSWPEPDNGASTITSYKIYRATTLPGPYALIAQVSDLGYVDTGFGSGDKFYRVTAVNGIGEGPYCHEFHPIIIDLPDPCKLPGVLVSNDVNPNGSDNDSGVNTPLDPRVNARQLYIAEPFVGGGIEKLFFTLFVAPSTSGGAPANSQWFIVWNRQAPDATHDRWYVAMRTDAAGTPSFEYGKFGVPLDPTNPSQTANSPMKIGDADAGSFYDPLTGTIRILLARSKAENVPVGNDLTGVNVRTYFNRPDPGQRSQNNASDITPDGSYSVVGNASCAPAVDLVKAVSRKTHGAAGPFDIKLFPIVPSTNVAIECRTGQPNAGDYKVVMTFAAPVTFTGAAVTGGGAATTSPAPGSPPTSEVTINLTGVSNAQTITVTLLGATVGGPPADISVKAGMLIGDTTGNRAVNSSDISQTQSQSGRSVDSDNFQTDVTVNGLINSSDISLVQSKSGTALP